MQNAIDEVEVPSETLAEATSAHTSEVPVPRSGDHDIHCARAFASALQVDRLASWSEAQDGLFTLRDHQGDDFRLTAREVAVFFWGAMLPTSSLGTLDDYSTD